MDIDRFLQFSNNSHGTKRIFVIVVTIAAIFLIATSLYLLYNQQRTIDELSDRNTSLANEIQTLKERAASDEPIGSDDTPASSSTTYASQKGVTLTVNQPLRSAKVTSPLTVTGSVPGTWSFEAQFSIQLLDERGTVLTEVPASLQGDWMTEQMVPFTAKLTFDSPATRSGTLMLKKANPSGLSEKDDNVSVPVTF